METSIDRLTPPPVFLKCLKQCLQGNGTSHTSSYHSACENRKSSSIPPQNALPGSEISPPRPSPPGRLPAVLSSREAGARPAVLSAGSGSVGLGGSYQVTEGRSSSQPPRHPRRESGEFPDGSVKTLRPFLPLVPLTVPLGGTWGRRTGAAPGEAQAPGQGIHPNACHLARAGSCGPEATPPGPGRPASLPRDGNEAQAGALSHGSSGCAP